MGALNDKIEVLKAEIDSLKRQQRQLTGADMPTEQDVARHRDEMHQLAERRMAHASHFTRDQLEEMRRATPDSVCRDLAGDARAPLGPRGMLPSSQPVGNSRSPMTPGDGSGWMKETPIRPPPGVAQADRLMDEADRRDRHDLMMQEARRLAAEKPK